METKTLFDGFGKPKDKAVDGSKNEDNLSKVKITNED